VRAGILRPRGGGGVGRAGGDGRRESGSGYTRGAARDVPVDDREIWRLETPRKDARGGAAAEERATEGYDTGGGGCKE